MKNIIFLDIDGVLNDNCSEFSRQMNGIETRRKSLKYQFEKLSIYNIDFIDPNFRGSLGDIKLPSRLLGIVDYLKKMK